MPEAAEDAKKPYRKKFSLDMHKLMKELSEERMSVEATSKEK